MVLLCGSGGLSPTASDSIVCAKARNKVHDVFVSTILRRQGCIGVRAQVRETGSAIGAWPPRPYQSGRESALLSRLGEYWKYWRSNKMMAPCCRLPPFAGEHKTATPRCSKYLASVEPVRRVKRADASIRA
ncbi:hypothetical protein M011DRAFT_469154 [Sporormia fimetaria CBS 119925]|uniref:Uncharacterized protein n=1 Tax=Sporormia fimetaria CBS 119925 TaxID=1340428 RepID=A0A6A6V8M2_9PLEO|nr:hypothetical protein M011DRAFT_469154 [Sporormia fimetaria CBS 119925]